MSLNEDGTPSTRPYLIRALHEWCTDCGFSPYMAIFVDGSVQVPQEFVKDNEIVLNVSYDATSGLELGNEYISFKARFGGVPRQVMVPVTHVLAIYAKENGQGMGFPAPEPVSGEVEGPDELAVEAKLPESRLASDAREISPSSDKGGPALRSVPLTEASSGSGESHGGSDSTDDDESPPPVPPGRPKLKLVK